jgi:hypothetical protein
MSETNLQLFPGVFRSTVGGENPGFFLHSDGRVGIGNKAPTARPTWDTDPSSTEKNKLNVSGHTHIDGNLNVTGYLYGDGSTLSGVAGVIAGNWDLDASNNIKYDLGNVGIGGVAGTERLTIYGDLNIKNSGQLKFDGADAVFSKWSSDTNGIYRPSNVGIGGVPSATNKLKVHGTVEASGFVGGGVSTTNTGNTVVKRDASGNFTAGTITANITGNVSGSSGSCSGNSATTSDGTSANNAYAIVRRDANRNINANAIYADLRGNLSGGYYILVSGYRNRRPYSTSEKYWKVDLGSGFFEHGDTGTTDDDSQGPYVPISIESRYSIHGEEQIFITSDKRVKTNIRSMDTDVCLEHVNNLNPVSYNKISKGGGFTPQIGLIAQEVENNLPISVMTNVSTLPNIRLYGTLSNRVYIDVVDDDGEKHEAIKFDLTVKNGNLNQLTDKELIEIEIEGKSTQFMYDKSICGDIQNNGTSLSVCLAKHKEEEIPHKDIFDDVWITGTEVNDVKSLDYNQILCVLMGAVKEIDKQRKQDNIRLESQLSQLMSRIETLEGS